MDAQTNVEQMLELMERPAFCVLDGLIVHANSAAAAHLVPTGQAIRPLIRVGAEEYADFSQGCLYLSVTIENTSYEASVTVIGDYHIFTLNIGSDTQLQTLALAAKEFREPLNCIMAISDYLPNALEGNQETMDMLARMNRRLYQILRMVNNMSDAGSQASAQMELRDVPAVMQELFDQVCEYCCQVGVSLEFENLPTSIYSLIDSQRLERAIYNLLSNSLKYTQSGGFIHARLTRRHNTLYLTVTDSGTGFESASALLPFERFLREPGIEDARHGLGLGLTIARNAAAIHGGTILLDRTKDSGTRITMSLPIRQDTSLLRSNIMHIDYAGERDHALIELSDALPHTLYGPNN